MFPEGKKKKTEKKKKHFITYIKIYNIFNIYFSWKYICMHAHKKRHPLKCINLNIRIFFIGPSVGIRQSRWSTFLISLSPLPKAVKAWFFSPQPHLPGVTTSIQSDLNIKHWSQVSSHVSSQVDSVWNEILRSSFPNWKQNTAAEFKFKHWMNLSFQYCTLFCSVHCG